MTTLYKTLQHHAEQCYYPFHMPGHKGGRLGIFTEILQQDITEIEGFDNLHQPNGILLESQKKCADIFGAEESFYLVNGSTSGILSAVLSACSEGEEIVVARNCHKSVYSALVLSGAKPVYVLPETIPQSDFLGSVSLKQVQNAVTKNTKAVIITSPTYEGITSDIQAISDFVHKKGLLLIVDEAHGSHMKFHDFFPKTALEQCADIVIQSLHKTLPCPTQTAVLHIQGNIANRKRLRQALDMVQTSSPSYIFLSAIDACCDWLQKRGKLAFDDYVKKLEWFYKQSEYWKNIILFKQYDDCRDKGKLILQLPQMQMTGIELNDILMKRYHLILEMGYLSYSIAMTSPADTQKGFHMLAHAITQIDNDICNMKSKTILPPIKSTLPIIKCLPREAFFAQKKQIAFLESTGSVSGEFVIPYPPGIPIIAPGELITEQHIKQINMLKKANISFVGCYDNTLNHIQVLKGSETI